MAWWQRSDKEKRRGEEIRRGGKEIQNEKEGKRRGGEAEIVLYIRSISLDMNGFANINWSVLACAFWEQAWGFQ